MKWLTAFVILAMALISGFMVNTQLRLNQQIAVLAQESPSEIPRPDFQYSYSPIENKMLELGLVDINKIDSRIVIQPVYATRDNLIDSILYPQLKRCFLQPEVALKLHHAQDILTSLDQGLKLVVLDAARPQHVQYAIWRWAVRRNLKKYVAAPDLGSVHNYGCAVDVTISNGDTLLNMGTKYDHFGPESEPRYQYKLLEEGILTQEVIDNRLLLKKIMRQAGFRTIQTEWWHFNGFSKEYARAHYEMIP